MQGQRVRVAVVTPELHRSGGTERSLCEQVLRWRTEFDLHDQRYDWRSHSSQHPPSTRSRSSCVSVCTSPSNECSPGQATDPRVEASHDETAVLFASLDAQSRERAHRDRETSQQDYGSVGSTSNRKGTCTGPKPPVAEKYASPWRVSGLW